VQQAERATAPTTIERDPHDRAALERRARWLAIWGNVWNLVEFVVALMAGLAASSVALIAFGIDSIIESFAGFVIIWLFTGGRGASATAERRAQKLIATSYFILTAYVLYEAIESLATAERPEASWVGIALAAVSIPLMLWLTVAKRRVAWQLGSSATAHEAEQNLLCVYLTVALLVGLLLNALLGWWWADPAAAVVIAVLAFKEGVESWRGDG